MNKTLVGLVKSSHLRCQCDVESGASIRRAQHIKDKTIRIVSVHPVPELYKLNIRQTW